MSNKLTKEQKQELQKSLDEIMKEAKEVVEDYTRNPSEISGSAVQVNQNSPFLDEELKGNGWKRVIRGGVEDALQILSKTKKKLDKKKKK